MKNNFDIDKEKLIEDLKNYEGVLAPHIIDYLKALIKLDCSVMDDYIDDKKRTILSELDIYNEIARYNIFNRILKIIQTEIDSISIENENEYINLLYDNFEILKFQKLINNNLIAEITLSQIITDPKIKSAEAKKITDKLNLLYDEKNPLPYSYGIRGTLDTTWEFNHSRKIKYYEEILGSLITLKDLSNTDIKKIELINKIHDLILNDCGLNLDNFEEENELNQKTLTKNIYVRNNIKYI